MWSFNPSLVDLNLFVSIGVGVLVTHIADRDGQKQTDTENLSDKVDA